MAAANSEAEHLKKEYIYLSRLIESHNQQFQSKQHKPTPVTNDNYRYKSRNNYQTQTSCRGKTFKNLVYRPVDKGNLAQATRMNSHALAVTPNKVKALKSATSPVPRPSASKVRRRLSLTVAKSRYKLEKVHSVSSPQQPSLKSVPAKRPNPVIPARTLPGHLTPASCKSVASCATPERSRRGSPRNVVSKYKLIRNSTKAQTSRYPEATLAVMGAKRVIRKYKVNNTIRSPRTTPLTKSSAHQSSSTKSRSFWQTSYRKTHYYRGQKHPSTRGAGTEVSPQWPCFINIGNTTYKASKTKLLRTCRQPLSKRFISNRGSPSQAKVLVVRGATYCLDPSGKSMRRMVECPANSATPLKRIDIGGNTYVETSPGMLYRTPSAETRTFLNRAINRSLSQVRHAKSRKCDLRASRYCMFFNRFGRCNKGDKCTYIHDPEKVAVCTRFLRGTCRVFKCPFSHHIAPDKMPVCSFFLRGCCTIDPCPYRHVKVNSNAEVCLDFVRGYCSQGVKCKKQHVLICPEFASTNKCSKGSKCRLTHWKRRAQQTKTSRSTVGTGTVLSDTAVSLVKHTKEESSMASSEAPARGKLVKQPQYISLQAFKSPQSTSSTQDQKNECSSFKRSGVRIRPNFLP